MFDPIYTRPYQYRPNSFTTDYPRGADDARSVAPDVAGEMARRASDVRAMIETRTRYEKNVERSNATAAQYRVDYENLKTKFTEKYGATDPAALLGDSDTVELSDRAKEYLADLGALERKRNDAEFLTWAADYFGTGTRKALAVSQAMDDMAAAGWDMRFSPLKAARVEAWNKFADAGNRMAKNGAENAYKNDVLNTQLAAVKAGAVALTEGLSGPALFKVSDDGRIDFSVEGLSHLSPDAQAAAQLKRLVEIMSVRNGFSPLRGAVAKALDLQNAYIANHPVVAAAVVELPF
ncbi:MAG: hypothetical protein HY059_04715 [Proteobacteria bacterium]|nr:hypothetical protein [Pseudomonadota bacterium]